MPADPLPIVLAQLAERIARSRGRRQLNEQNTKATLVEPLLRALGWDTEDLDEVAREFRLKPRDKPVDYGLSILRTPRLFVEAKALGENLHDRRWASQIMGYASVAGVEWIVLTDGDEYRLYNSHAPVDVDEKLFRRVRITEDQEAAERVLALLAKDRLAERAIDVAYRTHFVDRQVAAALEGLFAREGDLLLVNYVAGRTNHLSPEEIRASIARCNVTFDYPEALDVAPLPVPAKRAPKQRPTTKPPSPPAEGSLLDLIQAGVIRPPLHLARTYRRQEVRAVIEGDGCVVFEGQRFDSLSTAGGYAKARVRGLKPGAKLPSTNGWSFWRFRDVSGVWRPVGELRGGAGSGGAERAG